MLETILDIVVRTAVIYVVVLLGLRIAGKRHVAQLSILDLVLILLISNAVQNAMVGADMSLLGGVVAAVTLFILNYIVAAILFRFRKIDVFVEGTPTLLVHNGSIIAEHLAKEKITEDELVRAVREHGIEHVNEVKTAVMELDGTISVIPRTGGETRIETFKQRRVKFQLRKK